MVLETLKTCALMQEEAFIVRQNHSVLRPFGFFHIILTSELQENQFSAEVSNKAGSENEGGVRASQQLTDWGTRLLLLTSTQT